MLYSPGCSCCSACACTLCTALTPALHVVLASDGDTCCETLVAECVCTENVNCEWRGNAGTCCGFNLTVVVTLENRSGVVWIVVKLEQSGTGNFEKFEKQIGAPPVNCAFDDLEVTHVSTGGAGVPCCDWDKGRVGTLPPVDCGFCTPVAGDVPRFFLVELTGVANDKCHEVFPPATTGCPGYDGTYVVPKKAGTPCTWELILPVLVNCSSVNQVLLQVNITGSPATPTVAMGLTFVQLPSGLSMGSIRFAKTYSAPKNCNTINETLVPAVDFFPGAFGDNTCTGSAATGHFVAIP